MTPEPPAARPVGHVAVIVPTYNEVASLEAIVARLRAAVPGADILVVDDASPDGTGGLADRLAAADDHIRVLHRGGKAGLGAAYLAGFAWALERGYGTLVEIDADGSHDPADLPRLLDALQGADLVIGSRWVRGGVVRNWPWRRELLSRAANRYARLAAGIGVRDSTGGFRAYRAAALRALDLDGVQSQGYCFQVEVTLRTLDAGLIVREVPITFTERAAGTSKMSGAVVAEALWRVTRWGAARRLRRGRAAARHEGPPAGPAAERDCRDQAGQVPAR